MTESPKLCQTRRDAPGADNPARSAPGITSERVLEGYLSLVGAGVASGTEPRGATDAAAGVPHNVAARQEQVFYITVK